MITAFITHNVHQALHAQVLHGAERTADWRREACPRAGLISAISVTWAAACPGQRTLHPLRDLCDLGFTYALQVTLHTNGKELKWGGGPHEDLSYLFADIARDFENKS